MKNQRKAPFLFYALLTLLSLALLLFLPTGGSLSLHGGLAHLTHLNALNHPTANWEFPSSQIKQVKVTQVRHRPGSGPPSLASRIEVHLHDGQTIPLTRHFSNRRIELRVSANEMNQALTTPMASAKIKYQDGHIVRAICFSVILLVAICAAITVLQRARNPR